MRSLAADTPSTRLVTPRCEKSSQDNGPRDLKLIQHSESEVTPMRLKFKIERDDSIRLKRMQSDITFAHSDSTGPLN